MLGAGGIMGVRFWCLAGLALWLLSSGGAPVAELAASAAGQACRVTEVTDGDTLKLSCGGKVHRVRLLGYDTPETFQPKCRAERALGLRAAQALRDLVASGPVTSVLFDGRDRYGRDLAQVAIGGRDVKLYMLSTGLALPYSGRRRPDWCG